MKTLTQFIVKYLAPLLYKLAYENKDDFIRYARNALNAKLPVVWAVIQKKLGLSPNLAKLIENTAVQILDENALDEVPLAGSEDILPIESGIIYTIDQSKRVYTIYACVPTSTYLRWCASVGQVPSDAEYLKFLNTLEDEGLWNPLSGATSLFVALRAVKYFNELYPDKQVQLVHAKDMDATTYDMLYAGYQGVVTRKVSTGYSADRGDNKRIDSEIYANASWGHCEGVIIGKNLKPENVRVVDSNGVRDYTYDNDLVSWNADNVIMLDNYPDKGKYNNFYINDKIAGLMNSGFFSRSVFFFKPLFLEAEKQEESDYEKGLKELGIVENPNPDRVITEKLLITLLYRYAKSNDSE